MQTLPSSRTLDRGGAAWRRTFTRPGQNGGDLHSRRNVVREPLRGERRGRYRERARPAVHALHRGRDCRRRRSRPAGVSAEYGRFGGGMVTAITKSGGDEFSGSYRQSFNNDSWRTTSPFDETKLDKVVPTYEYTFGGPVIARPALWFFNAGRFQKQNRRRRRPPRPTCCTCAEQREALRRQTDLLATVRAHGARHR